MSKTSDHAQPEATHGSPGWIAPFVSWVREEVEILDFDGASLPNRLRDLLKAAGVKPANAKPHSHVEPEHDIPSED